MAIKTKKTKKAKKVNTARLLKLADFLDELPIKRFDFSDICRGPAPKKGEPLHKCGTVGCAIGWTPVAFPRLVRYDDYFGIGVSSVAFRDGTADGFSMVGMKLFNMPRNDVVDLFEPLAESPADGSSLPHKATPKQVAKRIRTYVDYVKQRGL